MKLLILLGTVLLLTACPNNEPGSASTTSAPVHPAPAGGAPTASRPSDQADPPTTSEDEHGRMMPGAPHGMQMRMHDHDGGVRHPMSDHSMPHYP